MKVKFVTTYPPTNCGIAIYSQYYVEALKKLCDIDVISIQRPKLNPLYFIKLILNSRKNSDLVHIQYDCGFFGTLTIGPLSLSGMYTPFYYLFLKLFGGPAIITTVHELTDVEKTYGKNWLYLPMLAYYSLIYKSLTHLSDSVLLHTSGSLATLSKYVKTDNAVVIPHACFVKPEFLPREDCKIKLGLSGKSVITMFGFVSKTKGHDLAIDVLSSLPEDVVLYIAGDGRTLEDKDYVRSLKEKVMSKGLEKRVIFHGYVKDEDAAAVMCSSDLILMPYYHIVQSGALNYSLAYLKPVIASDIGGFAEVANDYGSIITFKCGDVADARDKIMQLLTDKKTSDDLIPKISSYISAVNIDNIALRTFELYNETLSRK